VKPQKLKERYTLINSRISYAVSKFADVFVKGENLTDRKYAINEGYPMPGLIVFGGLNVHF